MARKAPSRAPRAEDAYEASERRFRELRRAEYQDWVQSAYPWKLWGLPWSDFGGYQFLYGLMVRAPGDPQRSSREELQAAGVGYGKQYEQLRKNDVAFFEKAILAATKDGRPRSLHRIAVETFNIESSMLPRNAYLAMLSLIYGQKLAFAANEDPFYVLLWNDAGWRRQHPEAPAPAHERFGQMELEERTLPTDR